MLARRNLSNPPNLSHTQSLERVQDNVQLFVGSFPRLVQPCRRVELERLLSECGSSWRVLARCRLFASLHLRHLLERVASRPFTLAGLPDLAVEQFRGIASSHGSMVMRDALLEEMFPPLPGWRSVRGEENAITP